MNVWNLAETQFGVVHVTKLCTRCRWRHSEDGELCHDCLTNPLFDREEAIMLSSQSERFDFMGWSFGVRNSADGRIYILCYKRLLNPEKAGEVMSQSNFYPEEYDRSIYRVPPPRLIRARMKHAAAWLIAHWWEHYLNICPCLNGDRDDQEDGNFRRTMMESLLWYDENVG